MEYTVQKLARLAGVSARTLRYYDEIGLLRPARTASSGYRIYGPAEVNTLQQILFYREMGVPLDQIGLLLKAPDYDRLETLRAHRAALLEKRRQLDRLLENVEQSIDHQERGIPMKDSQKFAGFKRELIDKNEADYGQEIREKYGDTAVEASNAKLLNMSEERYREMEAAGKTVLALLDEAFATGDRLGEAARRTAQAHKDWLLYSWSEYSPEAHKGLGDLYVADERFAAYYDRGVPGKAAFLRDAIHGWLES